MVPGPAMARPGSTTSLGVGSPTAADSLLHDRAELGGQLANRRRIVGGEVGNAQSATEIHGGDLRGLLDTELLDGLVQQTDDPVRGEFEAGDVEDLRTDMAVQTHQSQVLRLEHPADGVQCRTAGQRQPELLVLVCGGDELVGVRLDTDRETNEDILDDARLPRDGIEALDLDHRVQNDMADTGFDRCRQFGDGFVVAVEGDPLRREVSVQRNGQLTAGAHVE